MQNCASLTKTFFTRFLYIQDPILLAFKDIDVGIEALPSLLSKARLKLNMLWATNAAFYLLINKIQHYKLRGK